MNFCASAVMQTVTPAPDCTSRLTISATLYAAIPPHTPMMISRAVRGMAGSFGTPDATYPGGDSAGGAIFNSGNLAGTNCTFALNQSEAGGTRGYDPNIFGGTAYGGAVYNSAGNIALMNVTIASNSVIQGFRSPPSYGANLGNTNGTLLLRNSLVAFGLGFSNGYPFTISPPVFTGLSSNASGTITDDGFNMSSDGSCNFNSGSSFNFTDPKLDRLTDNGGPTLTMALLPDSPAIDFGTAIGAPSTDQRGFARAFGAGVDIGAFEAGPPTPPLAVQHNKTTLELSFPAQAGITYELQWSMDFVVWEIQEVFGPTASDQTVSRTLAMTSPRQFFRLRARQ